MYISKAGQRDSNSNNDEIWLAGKAASRAGKLFFIPPLNTGDSGKETTEGRDRGVRRRKMFDVFIHPRQGAPPRAANPVSLIAAPPRPADSWLLDATLRP